MRGIGRIVITVGAIALASKVIKDILQADQEEKQKEEQEEEQDEKRG